MAMTGAERQARYIEKLKGETGKENAALKKRIAELESTKTNRVMMRVAGLKRWCADNGKPMPAEGRDMADAVYEFAQMALDLYRKHPERFRD